MLEESVQAYYWQAVSGSSIFTAPTFLLCISWEKRLLFIFEASVYVFVFV